MPEKKKNKTINIVFNSMHGVWYFHLFTPYQSKSYVTDCEINGCDYILQNTDCTNVKIRGDRKLDRLIFSDHLPLRVQPPNHFSLTNTNIINQVLGISFFKGIIGTFYSILGV